MSRLKITMSTAVTVTCCGIVKEFPHEFEASEWLLRHVSLKHKSLRKWVETEARRLARSQNGSGYYDSNFHDGWVKAQRSFRHSWRRKALMQTVERKDIA